MCNFYFYYSTVRYAITNKPPADSFYTQGSEARWPEDSFLYNWSWFGWADARLLHQLCLPSSQRADRSYYLHSYRHTHAEANGCRYETPRSCFRRCKVPPFIHYNWRSREPCKCLSYTYPPLHSFPPSYWNNSFYWADQSCLARTQLISELWSHWKHILEQCSSAPFLCSGT